MADAGGTLASVLLKATLWRLHLASHLSERKGTVVKRLLDAGPEGLGGGLEAGLTNRRYLPIGRASRPTAYREMADLVAKGMVRPREGKGRSAAYDPVWPE